MEKERGAGAGFHFELHFAIFAGEIYFLRRPPRFPGLISAPASVVPEMAVNPGACKRHSLAS